jgi:hypothetical protein
MTGLKFEEIQKNKIDRNLLEIEGRVTNFNCARTGLQGG